MSALDSFLNAASAAASGPYVPRLDAIASTLQTGDILLYCTVPSTVTTPPTMPGGSGGDGKGLAAGIAQIVGTLLSPLRVLLEPQRPLWSVADDWDTVSVLVVPLGAAPHVLTYALIAGESAPTFSIEPLDYHIEQRAMGGRFAVRHLLSTLEGAPPTLHRALQSNIHSLCTLLNNPETPRDHETTYRASDSPCYLALHIYVGMGVMAGELDALANDSVADLFGDGGTIECALRSDYALGVEISGRLA